jgi:hypothetical protein
MESRYILVHLIRGEAKKAHEEITHKLAEHLDGFPIHERIVPHLTLKRWFELDEIGIQKFVTFWMNLLVRTNSLLIICTD